MGERLECRNISRNSLHRVLQRHEIPGQVRRDLLERVNCEIGRRTDVVGIFPNDHALLRLTASVVIQDNVEEVVELLL